MGCIMCKGSSTLALALLFSNLIGATINVEYQGRKFVYEGDPFTITCVRTAYGAPKWTKDGTPVIPNENNNVSLSIEMLDTNQLVMRLHVFSADLDHRGEYKCDSLSANSHRLEVVTSAETDEQNTRPTQLLKINETLELYCHEVEDNNAFQINWYKDGHRILGSPDERIIIVGRTLRVAMATEEDAGEYLCAVEVRGLSYPSSVNLVYVIQVTYAAHVELFPTQIRPVLSRNLTVECRAHGYPIPRIIWFVDDMPSEFFEMNNTRIKVLDNAEGLPNAVLFIENVTYEDVYNIACIAENREGFMRTSSSLAVRENMINTNEEYPGKGIILNLGSDLVLQCNTTDDPLLNVMWYKNGNTLNMTDSRVYVEHYNNTLVIHKPTEADTGSYMCLVNAEEMINATIVVKTKVKLHPFDSSRNIVQGQNIILNCNVTQGIPLPVLQWFKDGESLNLSDSRIAVENDVRGILDAKVTIKEADFEDRAEYMCMATNDVGSANTTILVRVKDKYAALWPFLGICAEVAILCTVIFVYEKKRQKPDFDESEADHTTENKTVSDQEDKSQDIRQRK